MKTLLNRHAAFTLLEIMLVIIIIVTLMAVLIPNLFQQSQNAKIDQARIYITQLDGTLAQYEMANSFPPSTDQGLRALVEKPSGEPLPRRWRSLLDKIQIDPWGMDYRYEFPAKRSKKSFDITSNGPDRQPNTADDIGNWD